LPLIFSLLFADENFGYNGVNFPSFNDFYFIEELKVTNFQRIKWDSPIPEYYLNKGDESTLINTEKIYSELSYNMDIDESKKIPIAPKLCKVIEKMNAYFCDLKTIIIIKDVFTEGTPVSDVCY